VHTFFLCSVLLIIVPVVAGGSGDAAPLCANTFQGLSSSSTSSTITLRDFFFACVEDLFFKEAKEEPIWCDHVVDLIRLVLDAVFEGSISAICMEKLGE
jgi:hypothetical protein